MLLCSIRYNIVYLVCTHRGMAMHGYVLYDSLLHVYTHMYIKSKVNEGECRLAWVIQVQLCGVCEKKS